MLKTNKQTIGIFGGSFDPPHMGHLKISKTCFKKLNLKKIYWIVTKKNPFKKKPFFSIEERLSKSKEIVRNNSRIKILFIDDKIKSSRTINVINYFRNVKKQKNLCLILGSDNLIKFHKWTSWKKIVKLTKLIIFSRRGYGKKSKESTVVKYLKNKNIIFLNNRLVDVSSSNIRSRYSKTF